MEALTLIVQILGVGRGEERILTVHPLKIHLLSLSMGTVMLALVGAPKMVINPGKQALEVLLVSLLERVILRLNYIQQHGAMLTILMLLMFTILRML